MTFDSAAALRAALKHMSEHAIPDAKSNIEGAHDLLRRAHTYALAGDLDQARFFCDRADELERSAAIVFAKWDELDRRLTKEFGALPDVR